MRVLHGGWVPAAGEAFVRPGRFWLWLECASEDIAGPDYRIDYAASVELQTLLIDELGFGHGSGSASSRSRADPTVSSDRAVAAPIGELCLQLPAMPDADSASNVAVGPQRPLPSPQLAQRLGVEPDTGELSLMALVVDAWALAQPLSDLDELRFCVGQLLAAAVAPSGSNDLQLGPGLRFWLSLQPLLKRLLRKDQYVPALRYRKKQRSGGSDVYPAWDIVAPDFDLQLREAARRMPAACTAVAVAPANGNGCAQAVVSWDKISLLKHYLYCQVTHAVTAPNYPQSFTSRFNDTFIKACLRADLSARVLRGDAAAEHYRQWQRWRRSLQPLREAGVQLGLQLLEAPSEDASWRLQLLAVSRQDPSSPLPLIELWQLDEAARNALQSRFGANPEQVLLTELELAARVYPPLRQALRDSRPDGLVLDIDQAFAFLKQAAWVLRDAGFKILVPSWWTPDGRKSARLKLAASANQPGMHSNSNDGKAAAAASGGKAELEPGGGYFSASGVIRFRYQLALGDDSVTPDEWRRLVASKAPLVQFRGQWIELDQPSMSGLLDFWEKHGSGVQQLPLTALIRHSVTDQAELDFSANPALADALEALHSPGRLALIDDPPGLRGSLRSYQKLGVAWLIYLEQLGLNGCLADDMGLGKTVQVIARLLLEGESADVGPTLLVAPTSVVGNWKKELARFAPQLGVILHHGGERVKTRAAFLAACRGQRVVITSYALARRDAKLLAALDWQRLVIDEAQNIKNPTAAQTRAIVKFNARHRLALTGTPIENRLQDLWSIMQFLNPGYLGSRTQFRSRFELPIQKYGRPEPLEQLKELTRPFILRRLKTDRRVIRDLPDKIEQVQYCNLTSEQASLYQAVVLEVESALQSAEGIERKGLMLSALTRLKQICNHPRQYLRDDSAFDPSRSHKLTRLDEMLDETLGGGDSALVFTQFSELGAALEKHLRHRHASPVYYLHGGVEQRKRERMVEAFQRTDRPPGLFLLSLRAGGVGITLTRASQVFHFDRWWNPAVEDQATDRAFRIGQTNNVFVHKFVTLGTLEERIDQMLRDKKQLAEGVIGSTDEAWLTELDNDQFRSLIALDQRAVA